MALIAKFEAHGMAAEKYDEVLRRLDRVGEGTPHGRLYHVAYGSHENLQVIDIYDSPEAMQAFGQKLVPVLQELGIDAKPDVQEVYNTVAR